MKFLVHLLWLIVVSIYSFSQPLDPQCNNIIGEATPLPAGSNSCISYPLNPEILGNDLSQVTRCFSLQYTGPINLGYLLITGQCGPVALYDQLTFTIYDSTCTSLVGSGTILPVANNEFIDYLIPNEWYVICYTWTPNCPQTEACPLIYTSLLPIELLYFKGHYDERLDCIVLSWATATEINVDKFVIQKSYDLIYWSDVVEVNSKYGNSNFLTDYLALICDETLKTKIYYRLVEVTLDGLSINHKIIVVNNEQTIDNDIQIFDISGRQLTSFKRGLNIVKKGNSYYKLIK